MSRLKRGGLGVIAWLTEVTDFISLSDPKVCKEQVSILVSWWLRYCGGFHLFALLAVGWF